MHYQRGEERSSDGESGLIGMNMISRWSVLFIVVAVGHCKRRKAGKEREGEGGGGRAVGLVEGRRWGCGLPCGGAGKSSIHQTNKQTNFQGVAVSRGVNGGWVSEKGGDVCVGEGGGQRKGRVGQ